MLHLTVLTIIYYSSKNAQGRERPIKKRPLDEDTTEIATDLHQPLQDQVE